MSAIAAFGATPATGPSLTAPAGGSQSMVATALSAALTRTPLLTQRAMQHSFDLCEQLACAAWAQRHRDGCAALLALAVAQRWLRPQDVLQALQAGQDVALGMHIRTSVDQLTDYLNDTARAVLIADWPQPDWTPWLSLELTDEQPLQLVLQAQCFWDFSFDLDGLPPVLGVAIAHTLDLINSLTEVDRLRDMAAGWYDDSTIIYERLVEAGVADDVEAAWVYVQDNPVNEYFDWDNKEHLAHWLLTTATFAKPTVPWMQRYEQQWKRWLRAPHQQRLQWLAQRRQRWQLHAHGTAGEDNPWLDWFDHALSWLRHAERLGIGLAETHRDTDLIEATTDWEALGYSQYIGFGETWEDGFSEEWQQYLSQSGNYCGLHINLRLAQFQDIVPLLQAIALGQGLLLSAWQANEAYRQRKQERKNDGE